MGVPFLLDLREFGFIKARSVNGERKGAGFLAPGDLRAPFIMPRTS